MPEIFFKQLSNSHFLLHLQAHTLGIQLKSPLHTRFFIVFNIHVSIYQYFNFDLNLHVIFYLEYIFYQINH